MFVSKDEFDYLKHYHNWALFFTMLTFVFLANASLTTEAETYELYTSILFELSLSSQILGSMVYLFFVDIEFWQAMADGTFKD